MNLRSLLFLVPSKVIYGTVTSAVGRQSAGSMILEKLRGLGIAAEHPLSEKLVAAMDAALLNARLYPNAADMKWSKMLTNLIANASSAILDMTAAEIFSHPGLFQMEMRMLREALTVMEAQGIKVVDLPGDAGPRIGMGDPAAGFHLTSLHGRKRLAAGGAARCRPFTSTCRQGAEKAKWITSTGRSFAQVRSWAFPHQSIGY